MNQVSVLEPDALIVLGLLVQLDVGELLLELKRVTHLIEKESNNDVSPAVVRVEALRFSFSHIDAELITIRDSIGKMAADSAS